MEIIQSISVENFLMYAVGVLLIFLAIRKKYEPALLLPMGFGAILVNLPMSGVLNQEMKGIKDNVVEIRGIIEWLYEMGLARLLGFPLADAASVGMIGAADGPTSILVSQILQSDYIGAIAVAAYSYMALVPLIQPITIKLLTTGKERKIVMDTGGRKVTKTVKIIFPIVVTFVAGFLAPMSVSLVGFLMFGNLLKECGVLQKLSDTAVETLTNLITLLLGITISFSMRAEVFVKKETLIVMGIGLIAFIFDTMGGVLLAKVMNLFLKDKINPMVGAAGISAFPMSARVVQKMANDEKKGNVILMQAVGANVSGQIASAVVGGLILGMFL